MKLGILVPSLPNVSALFAYDLANLVSCTVAAMPEHVEFGITFDTDEHVQRAREGLLQSALENGDEYILWLTPRMRFPRDALVRLLQRDVPMVGVNYAKNEIPTGYTASCKTTHESVGTESVDYIGFGVLLMNMEHYRNLGPGPWFTEEWIDDRWYEGTRGFCKLLKNRGDEIVVDHDLSKECSQIGEWEFRPWHVEEIEDGPSN